MIVDTLIQYGDEAATFTVDNTVNSVELSYPAGSTKVLSIGGVFNTFKWKESLTLLSIGAFLPLGFEFYPVKRLTTSDNWPNYVSLKWRNSVTGVLTTWEPNRYNLPSGNYELNIGAYLEPPDTVGGDFQLTAELPFETSIKTLVSMIGVPDSLNDEVFSVPIFAKIGHTLKLT